MNRRILEMVLYVCGIALCVGLALPSASYLIRGIGSAADNIGRLVFGLVCGLILVEAFRRARKGGRDA